MRLPWRALPAALMVVGLLPAQEASASSCTYYKYDAAHKSWQRVATLQNEDTWETNNPRGVVWDCKYCTLVNVDSPNDLVTQVKNTATTSVDDVIATVHGILDPVVPIGVNPFPGPDCPPVPPEALFGTTTVGGGS